MGQQETHAPQQFEALFDHLVSTKDEQTWHLKTHRLGDSGIDYQLECRWLLDRQITGLGTAQDLAELARELPVDLRKARSVSDQAALFRTLGPLIDRRQAQGGYA